MNGKTQKLRTEIDDKYKWRLDKIYSSDELWEKDFSDLAKRAKKYGEHAGKIGSSPESMLAAIKELEEIELMLERIFVYAKMRLDEDNGNSKYQEMNGKSMSLIASVQSETSFFTPELMKIPKKNIEDFLSKNAELEQYRFMLNQIIEQKKHILTEKEESILAKLGEVTDSSNTIFSMLNDADMRFGYVEHPDGTKEEITHSNYINLMESEDRSVRRRTYENLYNVYKDHINTLASLYGTSVKRDVIRSKIRNFSSSRNAALSPDKIDERVYDNLIEVIDSNLATLHEYIAFRKSLLGVEELKMFDMYVPLVKVPEEKVTFDDAVEIINSALKPLGNDYLNKLNAGIKSGWIDIYPNKGKSSGAYSFGSYDSDPYILTNFTGTLQDVLTLIHELGHSMHSLYTRSTQPFTYGDYSIFVAEVASTVNENLLLKYWLKNENDSVMKKYILNKFIEEFRATVFRQTMFSEFELKTHEHVENGGSLTAEFLCSAYDSLNTKYFGNSLTQDELIRYEWARIPHFYRAFYVYQYATGFSAASAISNLILNEGKSAVDSYKKFLSMGSSDYPLNELKVAGVDMNSKEPIEKAMITFKQMLTDFKSLI